MGRFIYVALTTNLDYFACIVNMATQKIVWYVPAPLIMFQPYRQLHRAVNNHDNMYSKWKHNHKVYKQMFKFLGCL